MLSLFKARRAASAAVLPMTLTLLLHLGTAVHAQSTRAWECRVTGDNDGCHKVIKAPAGKKIVGVKAACNLEHGSVSNNQLSGVASGTLKVVKKSDFKWFRPRGNCYVGSTKISSKSKAISHVNGVSQIKVGCFEHDKNGGDCHIKGVITLRDGTGGPFEEEFTYSTSLTADIPLSGVVPYFHWVNPGRGARLKSVRVAGNDFTRYVVHFLPADEDRSKCGSNVGVRVNPGDTLGASDLDKLFGDSRPSTPRQLYACKLARVLQPIGNGPMPISVTYTRQP